MHEVMLRPVFRVRDDAYCWLDVAVAGVVWSEWDRLQREVREGLACLRSFAAAGRPFPQDEIDAAAADFRYERELISADDAKAWFARWGITAEEWMGFIRRLVLRQRLHSRLAELIARHPVGDEEVAAATLVEAICAGELTRLAPRVAARAAVYDRLRSAGDGAWSAAPEEVAAVLAGVTGSWASRGIPVEESRLDESARRIALLELALREYRTGVATPRAIKEQIAAHHLDWIRVDYQTLVFASEPMAREALLCVREDSMDFEALAATSPAELRSEQRWISDVTGSLHTALLGARPGEVLGPFSTNGSHALIQLTAKRLPSADDAEVCQRAESAALHRALSAELQARVQWLVTL